MLDTTKQGILSGLDPAWNYGGGGRETKRCAFKVKWWQNLKETEYLKTTSLGPQKKKYSVRYFLV